jgi:hypothetical protein
MSTAVLEQVRLVDELAAVTFWSESQWQRCCWDVGGTVRLRWLVDNAGQPYERLTPDAIRVAAAVAGLLDIGPPPKT